jgi:hypothetical protein
VPVYLPRNLAALARLTAENPRYALSCVRLLVPGDTTYRAEATDGKRLVIARGNLDVAAGANDLPLGEVLVPAKEWKQGLEMGGNGKRPAPVGLDQDGDHTLVFASGGRTLRVQAAEGRWPPTDEVLPQDVPLAAITFDPKVLGDTLMALAALGLERVKLLVYTKLTGPIGLAGRTEGGVFVDTLVMPLA